MNRSHLRGGGDGVGRYACLQYLQFAQCLFGHQDFAAGDHDFDFRHGVANVSAARSPECFEKSCSSFWLYFGKENRMKPGLLQARLRILGRDVVQCSKNSGKPFNDLVGTVSVTEKLAHKFLTAFGAEGKSTNYADSIRILLRMMGTLESVNKQRATLGAELVAFGNGVFAMTANEVLRSGFFRIGHFHFSSNSWLHYVQIDGTVITRGINPNAE